MFLWLTSSVVFLSLHVLGKEPSKKLQCLHIMEDKNQNMQTSRKCINMEMHTIETQLSVKTLNSLD